MADEIAINGALNAPIGSGAANNARQTINLYKMYQQYAIEAQSNGQAPIPFEQWSAQFRG